MDADNYSIYQSSTFISEINGSVTELFNGSNALAYQITDLEVGTFYFKIIAFNVYGNTSSNCINITVFYPPGGFLVASNASNPDNDGNFSLNWTSSERADNYSIYSHTEYIQEIDNNER